MDPDDYYFICQRCKRAFQDPDAAAEHEDDQDSACLEATYRLVDGSVVEGDPPKEV